MVFVPESNTEQEIQDYISELNEATKCTTPKGPLGLIRSTSAPPICWTSHEESATPQFDDLELDPIGSKIQSIHSSIEYYEFYLKSQDSQRKKLVPPRCPKKVIRRGCPALSPRKSKLDISTPVSQVQKRISVGFETPRTSLAESPPFGYETPRTTLKLWPSKTSRNDDSRPERNPPLPTEHDTLSIQNVKDKNTLSYPKKTELSKSDFEQSLNESNNIPENDLPYGYDTVTDTYYSDYYGYGSVDYGYGYDSSSYSDEVSIGSFEGKSMVSDTFPNPRYEVTPNQSYDYYHPHQISYRAPKQDTYYNQSFNTNRSTQVVTNTSGGRKMFINEGRTKSLQSANESGYLADIITCSEGSRLVQKLMESATVEEKANTFNILSPRILDFSKDQFGNYVVQKFFDYGNEEHKPFILQKLFGHVMSLSLNPFGCRVIQKAIEYASRSPDILSMLIREVQECKGISRLIYDPNGNHVIQRFIEKSPSHVINLIIDACQGNIAQLAQNVYGCRIVQKLLQHAPAQQRPPLVRKIIDRTVPLSYNSFGNYVIQFLLENDKDTRKEIVALIYRDFLKLATNKYGSNVVEKCIIHSDEDDRELFCKFLLSRSSKSPLIDMMKNEFGNYVVQKLIDFASMQQLYRIYDFMNSLDMRLSSFPFGKYIQSHIDKVIKQKEKSSNSFLPN